MQQLRKSAEALFNSGHITEFVYVDDKFGNTSVGKEECKKFVRNNLDKTPFITHQEIWEEEFEDWWNNSTEDVRQQYCQQQHIEAENANVLKDRFTQFLPENLHQQYLSPQEFEDASANIIAQLTSDHQLMLLIDHALTDYGRNGEQLLATVANRDFVNCALFSGTFGVEEELDKWNESGDKDKVFTIAKGRLDAGDEAILEGLRNVLWLKQISKVKEQAINVVSQSLDSMRSSFETLDPSTFHKIVMDRSAKEGCWEFETLMRIVHAYMGIGMKQKMLQGGYAEFQDITSRLRNIKHDAKANSAKEEVIKAIVSEEVYEDGAYINQTFSQISNGDIFKVTSNNKEYMLLSQPCNLEIREVGKRGNSEYDQSFLVPVRDYAAKDENNSFVCKLQSTDSSRVLVADLARYSRVSLSVLDLVAFNPEGKAIIDLMQTADKHQYKSVVQNNMMLRYKKIYEKVKSYKDKYDKLQESNLDKTAKLSLSKAFCRPFEMGDESVVKHPVHKADNNNMIDFQIIRVRRYKDPYAKDLLALFMDYLSRPGYPMDLLS